MYGLQSLVSIFGILLASTSFLPALADSSPQVLPLSSDSIFSFEILRILAHARYGGSDIAEVLTAANGIAPGNFSSFSSAFHALADRVRSRAEKVDVKEYPVSVRDDLFAASNYYRAADFFIHGDWEDPEIKDLWVQQTNFFNTALSLLPIPGRRVTLKGDGFDIPAIFYGVDHPGSHKKRPTLIVGNGYDGSQEEMLHVTGFAALERGWNVITYEGPGQPTVRRDQDLGFIVEWEKVVTPVVDHLSTLPEVDMSRVVLYGYSFGGWLAARAAAFEHRISAVVAIDGVYSPGQSFLDQLPPALLSLYKSGNKTAFDTTITSALASGKAPTALRWGVEQGLWSFKIRSGFDFLHFAAKMTLDGLTNKIKVPVFVGAAENEQNFKGQPEQVKAALGNQATYFPFVAADGAGEHCQVGAAVFLNEVVFGWLDGVLEKGKRY